MASLSCSRVALLLLACLVMFQWALLAFLMSRQQPQTHARPMAPSDCALFGGSTKNASKRIHLQAINDSSAELEAQWDGVAVALILRRPKWFYKRYNVMIHNAMANIPQTWAVQLFVNQDWFENELLVYHRGLKRLVESRHPRLIVTPLPGDLAKLKPKGVLPKRWLWENVVADRVLLFHGDGTLCSNTNKTWDDFKQYHYVGVPWGQFHGYGGSGTEFSIRSRSAMLKALDFRPFSGGREDTFFVSTLLEMNKQDGIDEYNIAPPVVTEWFAGTNAIFENRTLKEDESWGPMIVSGTQAQLDDAARNWVLGTCPELKAIFPVLHNPNCFGAKPNPEACCRAIT